MLTRKMFLWGAVGLLGLGAVACGDDDNQGNDNNNNNVVAPVCGNGQVEAGEQCDEGADNSDTSPGACRSDCRSPFCGDGVVDPDEACDDGATNSDAIPNVCRTTCVLPACGDGVVDDGEECDEGAGNADEGGAPCRTTCVLPACGDGYVDPGQVCYAYYGAPSPQGMLFPVDLDDDGLADLAGTAVTDQVFLAAHNTGQGFSRARGYLKTGGGAFEPTGALRSGGTGRDMLIGGRPPLLVTLTDTGRLDLPSAAYLANAESWNHYLVAGYEAGGTRYLSVLKSWWSEHCRYTLDATGIVPGSRVCDTFSDNLDNKEMAPPVTLAGSGGQTVLAYTPRDVLGQSEAKATLVEFGAQGQFVGAHQETWNLGTKWFNGAAVLPVEPNGQKAWVAIGIVELPPYDGEEGDAFFLRRDWDATLRAFSTTAATAFSFHWDGSIHPDQVVTGRFRTGASPQDPLDYAFVTSDGQLCYARHPDGGALTPECCPLCPLGDKPHSLAAGDLDGDGVDEVVASLDSGEIRVLPGQGSGCGTATVIRDDLPWSEADVFIGRFDDNASLDVLVTRRESDSDSPLAVALLHGGANMLSDPQWSDVMLDEASRQFVPFPRSGGQSSDLVALAGGDGDRAVVHVPFESGRFRTGYPLQVTHNDGTVERPLSFLSSPVVTDLDADGHDDVAGTAEGDLLVYRGPYVEPDGFAALDRYPLPYTPGYFVMADVVGDTGLDVIMTRGSPIYSQNEPDEYVTILENVNGAFDTTPVEIETLYAPVLVATGDFDGDGDNDLVTVHTTLGLVVLLTNDNGTFSADPDTGYYFVPGTPYTAWPVDLDQDGVLDLAVSTPMEGMGPVWLRGRDDGDGHPIGAFETAVDLPLSSGEFAVLPAEMTGAPPLDLAVVKYINDTFATVVLRANP